MWWSVVERGGVVCAGLPWWGAAVHVCGSLAAARRLARRAVCIGGVLWVWLPIFGINEVPSFNVIIGGIIITLAVLFHGYGASKKREPVLP